MDTKVDDGMILVFKYWAVCMHFGTDWMYNGKMSIHLKKFKAVGYLGYINNTHV